MKPSQAPTRIFEHLDYRDFLREEYRARHRSDRSFSYRYIASKVGLDSGSVSRVFNGQRNIHPQAASRLARVFGLDDQEREYFETLVHFGQAQGSSERNTFLEKIIRLRNVKAKVLEERQYAFYEEWYHPALWALLNFYPFDGDVRDLARRLRPPIKPAEAEASLRLLREIGLVEERDGRLAVTDRVLSSGEAIRSGLLGRLHLRMAELAQRSLQEIPARERDFSGTMLTLSPKGFEKVKGLLKRCRREVMDVASLEESPECAYRLNLQLFPLSHPFRPGEP